jgi:hypothetical protein
MPSKTESRPERRTDARRRREPQRDTRDTLPTWRNTRPRGNPEPDRQDLERSRERFEALLGR